MRLLLSIVFAAMYGLVLRLLFVSGNDLLQVMSITFLFLVPMVIGFLTIILTPSEKTTTGTAAFFKPWLTSLVLLIGTIMLQIEGTICWIMVFPFFEMPSPRKICPYSTTEALGSYAYATLNRIIRIR